MSTKAPALKSTKEYRLFLSDDTNRSPRKLKKIMASMKQWGFLPAHPLAVVSKGAKMIIKDGQHRFECAKALGIPVYYVLSGEYDGISIPELNGAVAGAWNPMDYVQSFCNQGKPEYAKLRSFCEDFRFPVNIAAGLLSGVQALSGGNLTETLRSGRFAVKNPELARQVASVIVAAKPLFKPATNRNFINAVSMIVMSGVSSASLSEKIEKYPELLRNAGTTDGFLGVLEEVYNFRARERQPIKFKAIEAAKKRNASTAKAVKP
jgi:hypothetical protein